MGHLPAISRAKGLEVTCLVDVDEKKARDLAHVYGIGRIQRDANGIGKIADAAIVAVPHHLHAEMALKLLSEGLDLLVEKPLAPTVQECTAICEEAERNKRILAVGHIRRFYPHVKVAQWIIRSGMLGELRSFEACEGNVFNWPVTTGFQFSRERAGGVLMDTGPHTLDLLRLWFGELGVVSYRDDALGGVEANSEIVLQTKSGVKGRIELSRTRDLSNILTVYGSNASAVLGLRDNIVQLMGSDGQPVFSGGAATAVHGRPIHRGFSDLFVEQLEDFRNAVGRRGTPTSTGKDATEVIRLIRACVDRRQPLEYPWETPIGS